MPRYAIDLIGAEIVRREKYWQARDIFLSQATFRLGSSQLLVIDTEECELTAQIRTTEGQLIGISSL